MELRVGAMVANVGAMKRIYQRDGDIHMETAMRITGKSDPKFVSKAERSNAKPVNFGFLYGMSAETYPEYAKVTYGIDVPLKEAVALRSSYFRVYHELLPFYEKVQLELKGKGYINTLLGRRYKVGWRALADKEFASDFIRKAINAKVQSPSSDIALMAIIDIFESQLPGVRMVGAVHDSILFEVKENKDTMKTLHTLRNKMQNPALLSKFIKYLKVTNFDVPIKVDIEVGPWGSGKEVTL